MNSNSDRLYNLLPALYRIRDASNGEQLRALLAVIETELVAVEDDIGQLYNDLFIETCAEWVVPYIGDLLGARTLLNTGEGASLRAYVADTIAYRRRKGTAVVLEQLARDITGWPARAVEFFELLETTQNLNHVRPVNVRTPDLRDSNQLELVAGPFEQAAHTAELRCVVQSKGKYNTPNVGLFLWRLRPYEVERSTARPDANPPDGRYRFNPLGSDAPLFSLPQTETGITHHADEPNVPGPLRRRPLHDELEALRQAIAEGRTPQATFFGTHPVFRVFTGDESHPEPAEVPPEQIMICDLSGPDPTQPLSIWRRPPVHRSYKTGRKDSTGNDVEVSLPITVGVDPVLGRLALPQGATAGKVLVSYSYGFSADVGGGPYDRSNSIPEDFRSTSIQDGFSGRIWQRGVSHEIPPVPDEVYANLADAVEAWNDLPDKSGKIGIIAIMDSQTYEEDLTAKNGCAVQIPDGSRLLIVAADWPQVADPYNVMRRCPGRFVADRRIPHLRGSLSVKGTASEESTSPGELILNGLQITGPIRILKGNLGALSLRHTTVVPEKNVAAVKTSPAPTAENTQLIVRIERSICGAVRLVPSVPQLQIVDSIMDATADGSLAIAAPGAECEVNTSTILGSSAMVSLNASETIFTGRVDVERLQTGCVRFCYFPLDSRVPRRFRCQPCWTVMQAVEAEKLRLGHDPTDEWITGKRNEIQSWLAPSFVGRHYRMDPAYVDPAYVDPAYAQLRRSCPTEILTGAEDGSEMGVFGHLKQPQREANLRTCLDEYLRTGLRAGPFFVT